MRERIRFTLGPISSRIGHAHTFSPIFQKNARRLVARPDACRVGGVFGTHLCDIWWVPKTPPTLTPRPSQTQGVPPIQEPNSQNPKASLQFGSWFLEFSSA